MSWWPPEVMDRERWGPSVDDVLDRVARARRKGRFPQALLFAGPAGMGRELAAVETAVMLACADTDAPWSEGSCADRVRAGHHPDVMAVLPQGAAKKIKIEQIREVVDSAPSRPYEGRRRVWILDGVETGGLIPAAANAFLKVLEEPPEHVRFLLLAANPTAVLPTIRSRCQQLSLPGTAAVARGLGFDVAPGLAGPVLAGLDLDRSVVDARRALREALAGEVRGLVRLPQLVPEGIAGTEFVAAVALEEAGNGTDVEDGYEFSRLAADLLTAERRVLAVGLNRDRQLLATLMRWFRELPPRA